MTDPEIAPATPSEPQQTSHDQHSNSAAKLGPGGISFSIWPPTQRTRDAVVNRLIETLSTPSVLSKRYGTMTPDEASAAARQIEDEAFAAAGGSAASDDDGIEILQVYSKEISKRMLDTVKARANTGAVAVDNGGAQAPASDVAPPPAAESAPAESET
ncbi:hypothetical protein HN51_018818 [Arachis hypogaea]|uniref:WPP domain-containing protein n=2 Tax=Arachis TaxID=3817 RepID=A0A444WNW6_ARAHY|nr:MFP1 attachment factor 1 [Arachis duranensis]XP_025613557.1 MFP1 attachment factor 1 [Arachis hypogaea]XP_057728048.1 MFP1 attachment factor 1-like [Arachis stenosperma]QHO30455.1 WPP domain-containing protein [Arachis hypogaea]RYQ79091.1 hypothetical protein Ahy_Scaffold7g108285 [Arachis hypogaea]